MAHRRYPDGSYCGEPAEEIVPDNNADVGYHAVEEPCPACFAGVRPGRDCKDAQLHLQAPLILGWPLDEQ